jgi:four helix bundle protein
MDNIEASRKHGNAVDGDATRSNVVKDKSYAFALSIVQMARSLRSEQREWVLSKQLIRSGTSIGANIEEAIAAQSKRDFLSKMCIALKEARETYYWLRILMQEPQTAAIIRTCQELVRLLGSITLTTRQRLESGRTGHSALHIPHSTLEP